MKPFSRYEAGEIYRIFHSKQFLIVTSLLVALVLVDGLIAYSGYLNNLHSTLENVEMHPDGTFAEYPYIHIYTLYNSWIGGRPDSPLPLAFFFTVPIFAVIPYSWTYLFEEKTGYVRTMATHLGKLPYFMGKYFSVFLSGFFTMLIPMSASLIFMACLVPAYTPDIHFDLYYQVHAIDLLGNLYYSRPLAAAFINILMASTFAGLWAGLTYVVSLFVKNQFVALFAPYFVLLFIIASAERAMVFRSFWVVSILDYIRLPSSGQTQSLAIYLSEMAALFLAPIVTLLVKGGKSDVF